MQEFKDKVAVVTGAASGIGFGMAECFAREGMKVVLADVEDGALAQAEAKIKATGATTLAVRTDVSRSADVDALAEKTLAAFGAVHVVCNNAGVGGEGGFVWEQSLQNWRWVLGVNLWGVIHGLHTFVPILLRQKTEGHIVNTASMAGHFSGPFMSPYNASKFAVVTISESLHFELEMSGALPKVSVLCPGFVSTNIANSERNRPADLATEPRQLSEGEQAMREMGRQMIAAGMPPAEVATQVLAAIREERFYVFPHPYLLEFTRLRMENVLAQRNPTSNISAVITGTIKS